MRWFLPASLPSRPAHLPPVQHTGEVSVVAGPGGEPGRIVGGTYHPTDTGWQQVPGGWWINPTGSAPARLLRLDARDGTEIAGVDNHRWLVPSLFRATAGGVVWAGEQRLGQTGWAVPPPPEPWQSLGLELRPHLQAGDWEAMGQDWVKDIALRLLCSNYHLHAAELPFTGWVAPRMISDTLAGCIHLGG